MRKIHRKLETRNDTFRGYCWSRRYSIREDELCHKFQSVISSPCCAPAPRTRPGTKRAVNILAEKWVNGAHRFAIAARAFLTEQKKALTKTQNDPRDLHTFAETTISVSLLCPVAGVLTSYQELTNQLRLNPYPLFSPVFPYTYRCSTRRHLARASYLHTGLPQRECCCPHRAKPRISVGRHNRKVWILWSCKEGWGSNEEYWLHFRWTRVWVPEPMWGLTTPRGFWLLGELWYRDVHADTIFIHIKSKVNKSLQRHSYPKAVYIHFLEEQMMLS